MKSTSRNAKIGLAFSLIIASVSSVILSKENDLNFGYLMIGLASAAWVIAMAIGSVPMIIYYIKKRK